MFKVDTILIFSALIGLISHNKMVCTVAKMCGLSF